MAVVSVREALAGSVAAGKEVTVRGWVRTRRDSKAGISFIHVSDGSSFHPVQVVAPELVLEIPVDDRLATLVPFRGPGGPDGGLACVKRAAALGERKRGSARTLAHGSVHRVDIEGGGIVAKAAPPRPASHADAAGTEHQE